MRLSVFALICLSLTACGIWKKGYERISFSQEWDFVLGGGQTDAFISEGDTLCEGMDGYRKQFKLPEKDKGKVICLDFERATLNRKIWLNGHWLCPRPDGNASSRFVLTPFLNYGKKENILLVQTDSCVQFNSHRDSDSDIGRNVWLVKAGQVHVDNWGTNITIPVINADKSTVEIETPLKNEASGVIVEVSTRIQDREGKVLYQISSPAEIAAGGKKVVIHTIEMFYPERWSVRNPYLYTAIVEVKVGNELIDRHQTTFGMHSLDSI